MKPTLSVVGFAPNPGFPLNLGVHEFRKGADGQLEHYIDGDLRAVIPPEGWTDYAESWPQCAGIVGQMRRAPAAAAPTAPEAPADAAAPQEA